MGAGLAQISVEHRSEFAGPAGDFPWPVRIGMSVQIGANSAEPRSIVCHLLVPHIGGSAPEVRFGKSPFPRNRQYPRFEMEIVLEKRLCATAIAIVQTARYGEATLRFARGQAPQHGVSAGVIMR
jgi:hypothetical protein